MLDNNLLSEEGYSCFLKDCGLYFTKNVLLYSRDYSVWVNLLQLNLKKSPTVMNSNHGKAHYLFIKVLVYHEI